MATWLAVDQLDFRGAQAVASGWLRRAHACSTRSSRPGARLARLPRGLLRPRRRRHRDGGASWRVEPRSSAGASACRPRDARACARGRDARRVRARRGGHALPRRGHRGRSRRRGRRSRSPARGRAASSSAPAPPRSTSSGHPSGATASPSSPSATGAATCSRSAAPSTGPFISGTAAGPRPRSCSRPPSRTTHARGRRGWAGRSSGWRSCAAARVGGRRPVSCSTAREPRRALTYAVPASPSNKARRSRPSTWAGACSGNCPRTVS